MALASPKRTTGIPVAILGAGDYVQTETIPAARSEGFCLFCVADREPHIAAAVGREHGFRFATTDAERAIAELPAHGLVIVATASVGLPHSRGRPSCLCREKPPTVSADDVFHLDSSHGSSPWNGGDRIQPTIPPPGSPRRSTHSGGAWSYLNRLHGERAAVSTQYWYFWANQGTRFTGNLCHWIDLAIFFLNDGALPVSVNLSPRVSGSVVDDEERVLTVTFDDGSLLTILGSPRGDHVRGVPGVP